MANLIDFIHEVQICDLLFPVPHKWYLKKKWREFGGTLYLLIDPISSRGVLWAYNNLE